MGGPGIQTICFRLTAVTWFDFILSFLGLENQYKKYFPCHGKRYGVSWKHFLETFSIYIRIRFWRQFGYVFGDEFAISEKVKK